MFLVQWCVVLAVLSPPDPPNEMAIAATPFPIAISRIIKLFGRLGELFCDGWGMDLGNS